MVKVAILGIGRMGKNIIKGCLEEELEIVAAVDAPDSPLHGKDAGKIAGTEEIGVEISSASELEQTLEKTEPDVVVDFTNAEACYWNSKLIFEKGINMVIGTTGFSKEQKQGMKENIEENSTGAVISPNMSVGVNVFWELIKQATKALKDYDIEILEKHHRFKKDSPSGTALKTAEIIAHRMESDMEDVSVYGRKGMCPREENEIGIHAVRGGGIVGEHTVLYAGLGEQIEITHKAGNRKAFVDGVIRAIRYIEDKEGIHSMKDVLGL